MLEIGKTYTQKELALAIGIKPNTFSKNKDIYLKALSQAYEYETDFSGRTHKYTIITKIEDYQKPERKRSRAKTDAIVSNFVDKCISILGGLQTATNIWRISKMDLSWVQQHSIQSLGLSDNTKQEYIRLSIREGYGTKLFIGGTRGRIEERVWCYLDKENNEYIKMTPQMVDSYFKCFDEVKEQQKQTDIDTYEDYEAGLITREEWMERNSINTENLFKNAKKLFLDKHGFWPIKVPYYKLNAWADETKSYTQEGVVL